MEVYRFLCQTGISKPTFHVINRLNWFVLDSKQKIAIPSSEATLSERVKIINKTDKFTNFRTRAPYIMVTVNQQGYKVGNYTARIIIRLGSSKIIRVDTFTKPSSLFFEGEGNVMNATDIQNAGLNFIGGEKRTAPLAIIQGIISTREPGFRINETRGIFITKAL